MLRNYSLVALGIENDIFEIHRLVQFATRKWLEQRQEMKRWKETYIAIIADAFPPGRYENWKRYRMLFPTCGASAGVSTDQEELLARIDSGPQQRCLIRGRAGEI